MRGDDGAGVREEAGRLLLARVQAGQEAAEVAGRERGKAKLFNKRIGKPYWKMLYPTILTAVEEAHQH